MARTRKQHENGGVCPTAATPETVNCKCEAQNPFDFIEGLIDEIMSEKGFCIVPEKILKSGNATIVFWTDKTKTIVRCPADTTPNDYEAFTAALAIKLFGSNSQVKKVIEKTTVVQKPKAPKKPEESFVVEGGVEE